MRRRGSNRRNRFHANDTDIGLSDDEQADLVQAQQQNDDDSSDEVFVVEAAQPDDHDDHDADLQESSDFESLDGRQPKTTPSKQKSKRSWAPNPARPPGEVQPYPTDPSHKWTRTYVGPVKRWTRLFDLVDYWFGDRDDRKHVFSEFMEMWWDFELLPPKLPPGSHQLEKAMNGWMPDHFAQDQQDKFHRWYQERLSAQSLSQTSTLIDREKAFQWLLPDSDSELSVLLGHVTDQKEYRMRQGETIPFSDSGLPIDDRKDKELQNGGWLVDAGGIVLSMGWAPIRSQADQFLALTVIPHSDQAFYRDLNDAPKPSDMRQGTVQIWKFKAEKDSRGITRPSRSSAKLVHGVCSHWGRATRMQWCPIPLTAEDQVCLLAVLFSDGKLRIIEIRRDSERKDTGTFEEMQEPMITIEPPKEYTLEINCFAWINMNRIAVALSDGSVVLWSLAPCQPLLRHPIHSCPILDIVSGYPSYPFLVATMPMGGVLTLTDLNRPTAEKAYHGNLLVSLQPGVLTWSEHIRGFASVWPSAFPGTSTVSFVQSRVFPLSRHICTVEGQTTCLTIGECHPYILIGCSDGSVWALNVMRKIASHRKKSYKIKVFQHEYHPPQPSSTLNGKGAQVPRRGACRILHSFLPEVNHHPMVAKLSKDNKAKVFGGKKKAGRSNGESSTTKSRASQKTQKPDDEASDGPGEIDEDNITMAPGPIVVHEPLTRITALSWNPNAEFGWWAAAAMGSGLVRVMDLGIETQEGDLGRQNEQTEQADADDISRLGAGDEDPRYTDEMEEDSEDDVDMIAHG
ncbi:hypothetical protein AAE478_000743 [Parahypoxylon ruwenzoriense]